MEESSNVPLPKVTPKSLTNSKFRADIEQESDGESDKEVGKSMEE